jgi:hypothetical protein
MGKAILALILSCTIFVVSISAQAPEPVKNTVCVALVADHASPETCRKWYAVYKGMYLYLKELDGQNTNDFQQVFDKLRLVRDKIQPAKGSVNFTTATQVFLDKYKETAYKPETRTDMAEDILYISEGIKEALVSMEK